jgi:cell division protein ZapE
MILGRLFTRLFELGVVLVATSNVAPDDLYKDGLNRSLFLPFIDLLKAQMTIVRLEARTDFRLEKLTGQTVWHMPARAENGCHDVTNKSSGDALDISLDDALDESWRRLTNGHAGVSQILAVKGRTLRVPRAAMGVARFSFHDLCEQPLAAADYLKIAHEYHTIVLDRIPVIRAEQRNEAKRFIILIDTLYDNAVKLVASAAAEPDALYCGTDGYEALEFQRTSSRLIEMRSEAYLALPHGRRDSQASPVAEGIVET